jgi:hypothetical protein
MRGGQIQGVTFLKDGPDESLIEQANEVLEARSKDGFEGVEVWSGTRFVYRTATKAAEPNSN